MLVLCGLGAAVPAIYAQGFTGSRIYTVDNYTDRDRALSTWVMGHRRARITYPQKRDDATESGNEENFCDDDEIGYKRTPQLEHTTRTSIETELLQTNDEGLQSMGTIATYKQNTSRQSKEQSRASTTVHIVRNEHGLTTIPLGGEGLSVVLLALKDQKEKERKRRQSLEEPLLEQLSIDKEIEQIVDKRSKGILTTSEQIFTMGIILMKKRSQKKQKTFV